jgi:hypothetical protein
LPPRINKNDNDNNNNDNNKNKNNNTTTNTNNTNVNVNEDMNTSSDNDGVSAFAAAPSALTERERAFIASLDDDTPVYRLFRRLCVYFRGQHHIEEIMWRENVERLDLLRVLEKYKRYLVQHMHEEREFV